MEEKYYMLEAVDRDEITWSWVDDKAVLDGKGPREVRKYGLIRLHSQGANFVTDFFRDFVIILLFHLDQILSGCA